MNPSAIYSKSGKGVQEASGKTSLLKRADRAVLSAIDGRATLADVARKVGRPFDAAFEALIVQLDREGFVREVSGGMPVKAQGASQGGGLDLDFTTIMPIPKVSPPKPADPAQRAKEQESALYKARQEAEARAQAERERLRTEAEAKARAEVEAKARAEAQARAKSGADDVKAKAALEKALRLAAEAKAKAEADKARLEAERKAREEAERKAREEAERARREAEDLRQRLEAERKAREEAERKAHEEAERKAREEAERKAREEEERRRKEEEARKAREEEERRARQEEERRAREEAERKAREEAERRAREEEARAREEERRVREEEERRAHEEEEARARRAQEEEIERARREAEHALAVTAPHAVIEPEPTPEAAHTEAPGSLDTLMADLDSFSRREEDERRSKEAAERAVKEERAHKLREESERRANEQAESERRAAEERRRREEEQRRAQEEAARRAREAEAARRREAEERERKEREATAAAAAVVEQAQSAMAADDIGITDADLDMEDVRRDEALVAKDSRKTQREREREEREHERRARELERQAKERAREHEARERGRRAAAKPAKPVKPRRPVKWGKPVAITFFVLLAAAIGLAHVMPIPTGPYERAASEALGRPVRISSARFSLFDGVRLNLERVRIADAGTIALVRAYPELGSLFGGRQSFSRIELEGATVAQHALGEALLARTKGENFRVARVLVKQLNVQGGFALPPLEAEALIGRDGAVRSVTLRGPEDLVGKVIPSGGGVEFDVTARTFALPVLPAVSLSSFAMKGRATRQGINVASWGGAIYDGALSGVANLRWTGGWQVDGVVTVRNINAAVFAPALLSEGRAEGAGRFSMSARDPATLANSSRLEGKFTIHRGVLGSFDLSRLIQTSGRQAAGRTQFAEMTGQGVYDRGAVALRDLHISAGALNAGASADIARSGALSGRIVADVKTATQTLRQTLVLGGTVKEPQVRN